jgi:galactitol-specific phosphotransferase system IIB component
MLDKAGLKTNIKTMLQELNDAEDQNAAIEKFATDFSNAMDIFVKTASIHATPANVTAAAMVASGNPVTSANNLNSVIQ